MSTSAIEQRDFQAEIPNSLSVDQECHLRRKLQRLLERRLLDIVGLFSYSFSHFEFPGGCNSIIRTTQLVGLQGEFYLDNLEKKILEGGLDFLVICRARNDY